ncbi:hypothetical protein O181_009001 [Austropuccinia psidii MF-1]|uniref:Sodium/calcium exchanger membrane region domain-containing protein n=1 Tax=Austropuccinia psidii MF-1 TaxID=1389203 RepID=A0A9Q3GJ24_9BASI|nr:hypothetical protein [Austropuccinia psidii MF-1]
METIRVIDALALVPLILDVDHLLNNDLSSNQDLSSSNLDQNHLPNNDTSSSSCSSSASIKPILTKILKISDAILGLTIFGIGNSLGDFIANVTIARMGFPVMAISACFRGFRSMLNILLGIGLSSR